MPKRSSHPPIVLLIVLALLPVCGMVALAQVEVAPTRVLISQRQRSQEVVIYNPTADPVEVETDLGFKLIRSDSLGRITLDTVVSSQERARSCRDWVKIYPRRFIVPPGSSRAVRIMAIPPDTLTDGEYWGRAVFGCTPMKSLPPDLGDTLSTIRTNLTVRLELDIPIIFRVGPPSTGIRFDGLTVRRGDGPTLALLDVARLGNSAYRGTLTSTLRSAGGAEIGKTEEQFTVEFGLRKAIELPTLSPGTYTLEIESASVKKGAAIDVVIAAPSVKRAYELVVTEGGVVVREGG